jgi:hypothetical protein
MPPRTLFRVALAPVLCLALVSACSGDDDGGGANNGSSKNGSASTTTDAAATASTTAPNGGVRGGSAVKGCPVDAAAVKEALGIEVGDPEPEGSNGDPACQFKFSDGSGSLVVVRSPTDSGAANGHAAFKKSATDLEPVPGIGTDAQWSPSVHQLSLLDGKRNVQVQVIDLHKAVTDEKAAAIALAKLILAKS